MQDLCWLILRGAVPTESAQMFQEWGARVHEASSAEPEFTLGWKASGPSRSMRSKLQSMEITGHGWRVRGHQLRQTSLGARV